MISHTAWNDEDKQRIIETIETIAEFEEGDVVTVEPSDHEIPYAGQENEGMPLRVEGVTFRGDNLTHPQNVHYTREPDHHEERFVGLSGDYEYYQYDEVYVKNFEYNLVGPDGNSIREGFNDTALIPWEEYREEHDRIFLPCGSDNTSVWLAEEEPCKICGCNLSRHSYWDNGVVNAGREVCPACGDVKRECTP